MNLCRRERTPQPGGMGKGRAAPRHDFFPATTMILSPREPFSSLTR